MNAQTVIFQEPDPGELAEIEKHSSDQLPRSAMVVLVGDNNDDDESYQRLLIELLEEDNFTVDAVVSTPLVKRKIRQALETAVVGGADLVLVVGGTGVGPRDATPEATKKVLDKRLMGLEQALRASGLAAGSPEAGLSRGMAGVSGQTVIVNLARTRAAVRDGMATLGPLAHHIIQDLDCWQV